jgi:hypothetical protein
MREKTMQNAQEIQSAKDDLKHYDRMLEELRELLTVTIEKNEGGESEYWLEREIENEIEYYVRLAGDAMDFLIGEGAWR